MPLCRSYLVSCFFFQAEDGIRDLTVTGVQTCALPISRCIVFVEQLLHQGDSMTGIRGVKTLSFFIALSSFLSLAETIQRSEERRVGKECRSRWSPYH